MISVNVIEEARTRITQHIVRTPMNRSESLSQRTGANVYLKFENKQRTGSFKERGACNRLLCFTEEEKKRGAICASAGNHAQGVAYHATRQGIGSTIVMPEQTPINKVERTRAFGGRVVLYGATYEDAYAEAKRLEAEEGRVFIHPFDDEMVIAGQGTLGLELHEAVPNLDYMFIAIGGGGLAAGVATALRARNPEIRIVGVETTVLPSMREAIREGAPVTIPAAKTIAEGIAVRRSGAKTFEILRPILEDIELVSDEEIAAAILFLFEEEKTVAEGAGAAAVAALLQTKRDLRGKNVGIILCGGNIDVHLMSRILDRGLVNTGRMVSLEVKLPDVAGALARLLDAVAKAGGNVLEVRHERAFANAQLSEVLVELVLETKGFSHIEELVGRVREAGYEFLSK